MKVIIACEESQIVCKSFRARGHEAYSCDLQYPSGSHPEWHILGDTLNAIQQDSIKTMDGVEHYVGKWDLIIAHPPCTYLSNAGSRWLFANGELNLSRYEEGIKAKDFFMKFYTSECEHIAIENPIPATIYELPRYTQIIQPYEYGEPWSKKTCLWLKGLPKLTPTNIINEYVPFITSGSYSKTHDPRYSGASRKGGSAKARSKTFKGIAEAMAEQWGNIMK